MRQDPLANPESLIRPLYAYVAYRIGSGAEAEDVTSDVLERALRYRDRFDARRGEPLSWLIGIARRCIADAAAAAARATGEELPEGEGVVDLEDRIVGRLDLAAALARLEQRDRELIALRYGADLTARQIGALLSLSTNAVEVALHRALRRLAAVLEPGQTGAQDALASSL